MSEQAMTVRIAKRLAMQIAALNGIGRGVNDWPLWMGAARRMLEDMHEPTRAMVAAANRNNHPRDEDTWKTMIVAALEEK